MGPQLGRVGPELGRVGPELGRVRARSAVRGEGRFCLGVPTLYFEVFWCSLVFELFERRRSILFGSLRLIILFALVWRSREESARGVDQQHEFG